MPRGRGGGAPRIVAEGLKDLDRDLRAIDRTLVTQVGGALARAAKPIVHEAQTLAPRGTKPIPETRVPRKRLADTIAARRRGLSVTIAASGPHAKIVHEGGKHPLFGNREHWITQRPRPFIKDAIDDQADRVMNAMADETERVLSEHGFHWGWARTSA